MMKSIKSKVKAYQGMNRGSLKENLKRKRNNNLTQNQKGYQQKRWILLREELEEHLVSQEAYILKELEEQFKQKEERKNKTMSQFATIMNFL